MREMPTSGGIVGRALSWLVPFLVVSAAYLYTFPQPNILYAAVVLLHALGGVLVVILRKTGTPRTEWNKLYFHIVISLAGAGLLIAGWLGSRESSDPVPPGSRIVAGAVRAAI